MTCRSPSAAIGPIADLLLIAAYCVMCAGIGVALILLAPISRPSSMPAPTQRGIRLIASDGRLVGDGRGAA